MKIALVHDYLAQDGGAERVLKAFHEIWPEAPIFVLFHDRKKIADLDMADVRESFLTKLPFINSHYQWYLPLMPMAIERHNFEGFDVVLSSTSSFAKGILTTPDTLHISYCHTPPRYLWSDAHHYIADMRANTLIKTLLPRFISQLRLWDKMSADRVDHFIANSKTVRSRIQKYYRRDAEVIHPPVELEHFTIGSTVGDYYVAGGRLVPYKNMDIVVQAFNRLRWPLKIFGTGPEHERLRTHAKSNIEFTGRVSDSEKAKLLSSARAFIHPQAEDFGITPLESMASGRPVIAFGQGGATETVIPNETGIFFNAQSWESLVDTLLHFDHTAWDSQKIRDRATLFSKEQFKNNITHFVNERFEEFKKGWRQPHLLEPSRL